MEVIHGCRERDWGYPCSCGNRKEGTTPESIWKKKISRIRANLTLIVNRRGRNGIPCLLNLDSRE